MNDAPYDSSASLHTGPYVGPHSGPHIGPHIGIDEAGRGCLAGPVTAAAVVFPPDFDFARHLPGVDDSKALSAKQREALAPVIRHSALAYGVGFAWPEEIDRVNILCATFRAMSRAVFLLQRRMEPGTVLPLLCVDGNHTIPAAHWQAAWERAAKKGCPWALPVRPAQTAIVDGDALVPAISAASILAKTARDRLMDRLDRRFPGYGFSRHKGYATREHLAALARLSPSPVHRMTFRRVRPEATQGALPGIDC